MPFFNRYEDLIDYVDHTYDVQKIANSITKSNNVFFFSFYNNQAVGFAKVKKQSLNKQISDSKQMELQKIYVLKAYHGAGIAQALLHSIVQLSKEIQPDCIWLDVVLRNERAIHFYEKNGFKKYDLRKDFFKNRHPDSLPLRSDGIACDGRFCESSIISNV
jgi:ribosomal protein S18 acetylase RimI-like enzyme